MVNRKNICLAFRTREHPASRGGRGGDPFGGYVWVQVPTGLAINPLALMSDGTLYDPLYEHYVPESGYRGGGPVGALMGYPGNTSMPRGRYELPRAWGVGVHHHHIHRNPAELMDPYYCTATPRVSGEEPYPAELVDIPRDLWESGAPCT